LQEGTLLSVPKGFKDILVYVKKYYKNPKIYITENGMKKITFTHVNSSISTTFDIKNSSMYWIIFRDGSVEQSNNCRRCKGSI